MESMLDMVYTSCYRHSDNLTTGEAYQMSQTIYIGKSYSIWILPRIFRKWNSSFSYGYLNAGAVDLGVARKEAQGLF